MKKRRLPLSRRASILAGTSLLITTSVSPVFADSDYHFYDVPTGETQTVPENLTNDGGDSLQKSGGGTLILTGSNTYSNATEVISGTLNLSGSTASINQNGSVFIDTATFNVENGSHLTAYGAYIGYAADSNGVMTITGPGSSFSMTGGDLSIGDSSNGILNILEGGSLNSGGGTVFVGALASTSGTVLVSGSSSTWDHNGVVRVGNSGTAHITVQNGASVTSGTAVLGYEIGSYGVVAISGRGSSWDTGEDNFWIGVSGSASLTISDGGLLVSNGGLVATGSSSDASILVTGTGSQWVNNGLSVGRQGQGMVTISNGGLIRIDSEEGVGTGTLTLGRNTTRGATLYIGGSETPTEAGFLQARTVTTSGTTTRASIIFNHTTDGAVFSANVEGTVRINHLAGHTILTGNVATPYELSVSGGKLAVSGSEASLTAPHFDLSGGELAVLNGAFASAATVEAGPNSGVTVASDGLLSIDGGNGTLVLSGIGLDRAFLNIGAAPGNDAIGAGYLDALEVTAGQAGMGVINFNHNTEESGVTTRSLSGYFFTPEITGDIQINHFSGITVLDAVNSYTGSTNVFGGTLKSGVQGALSADTYLIVSGSSAVYDLNGFEESVSGFALANGGSVLNGSLASMTTIEAYDGTISAVLSGTVGLVKYGTGKVVLEGDNTYSGTTSVEGGTLIINGSVAGNVEVTGGILGGDGFIGGNLFNASIVSPGNSPGTLTVAGNYEQASNGTYYVEIASKNDYDRLVVGGSAQLNGGALSVVKTGYKPKRGERYKILTAAGGVYGTFSEVESYFGNTLRRFDVDYLSNAVVIEYSEGTFLGFAKDEKLSDNVKSVARSLDKARVKGKLGKLMENLYDTQLPDLGHKLQLLSPEQLTQIYQIGFATAQVQFGNLERRLSDVRDGAIGFSTNGLALSNSRGTLNYDGAPIVNSREGITLAGWDGKSVVGKQAVAPVVEQSRWGFFATGNGEWADVETTSQSRGSEFSTGGFTLGADYRISDNFVVGIAGGYANTGSELSNGGKIDVNSGRGSLYASAFGSGFYLNTTVGGAYNAYDTKRGTLGGIARGSTEGGEFDALIGGGYDYRVGGFSVGPVASLQYTYLGLSSFTETGSDAPQHFSSQSQNSLKSSLGGRISYAWNVGGVVIKPEVRAQWQHEFLDSTAALESSFASGAGTFTVNGPSIGRDSLLLDAGAAVQFNPAVSIFAYYTGEIGRTNYSSNTVSGGFRINF